MIRSDIACIEISDEMLQQARQEAKWLKENKAGQKTRAAAGDRDIIGSLAHQAAEVVFDQFGMDFESTREIKYKKGDTCDIVYDEDRIDVKGTRGKVNEKWFYNESFLVFQEQVNDPKFQEISHLMFVRVDQQTMEANIYGVIPRLEFLEKCQQRKAGENNLPWDGVEIKARELVPVKKYIFRI